MLPLEDTFADILGKAQRGSGLTDVALADAAGVSLDQLIQVKSGSFDSGVVRRLCDPLQLKPDALARLADGQYSPRVDLGALPTLRQFNTPYQDMTVNAYVVWEPASRAAAIFDSGADASPIMALIQDEHLQPQAIFLTHTHGDHVLEIERLHEKFRCPVHVSEREPFHNAQLFSEGASFSLGSLPIETRLTWGHSRGGTTYIIRGLAHPIAIVGDALFAGSMGGGMVSYADALATNRRHILSLPDDTVLCPGHGPLTTVAQEKLNNPFFP